MKLDTKHEIFSFWIWCTRSSRTSFYAASCHPYTKVSKWSHFFNSPNCWIFPTINAKFTVAGYRYEIIISVTIIFKINLIIIIRVIWTMNIIKIKFLIVFSRTQAHFLNHLFFAYSFNIYINIRLNSHILLNISIIYIIICP